MPELFLLLCTLVLLFAVIVPLADRCAMWEWRRWVASPYNVHTARIRQEFSLIQTLLKRIRDTDLVE